VLEVVVELLKWWCYLLYSRVAVNRPTSIGHPGSLAFEIV